MNSFSKKIVSYNECETAVFGKWWENFESGKYVLILSYNLEYAPKTADLE